MPRLYAIRSFYDNRLGLITLDDDVLGIVQQVRELYDGKVVIELDESTGVYHFVELCEDATERLIFSTTELDPRALERLQKADGQWRYHEDPYDAAEREQDEAKAAIDRRHGERIMETGEMLAHALQRDGRAPRLPKAVAIPRDVDA